MASLMNGLSSLGAGVSAFAGAAGLEAQKASLAQDAARLADSLATTRGTTLQAQAGDIAATAAEKQQTFTSGENTANRVAEMARTQATINAPTPEMKNVQAATDPNTPQTQRDMISRNLLPKEAQLAEYMKSAPPEMQETMNSLLMGRPRYSFQPTTMPDPDNPGKFLSGVNKQDTRTGDIQFVPTGTNPNNPNAGGGQGNRAELYFNRTTKASTLAAEAAKNIMDLPIESSSGYFAGRGQSTGLMAAAKETLVNAATSQAVQDYNVMVSGLTRNLSTIESSGLAPPGSFTKSMDSVVLKEGDSELTKMRKMAEVRQIVEMGAEPDLANPKISTDQKAQLQAVVDKIKTAIPFTHADITALQRSNDPKITIADVVNARLRGAPLPMGGPTPDNYSGTGAEGTPAASTTASPAAPPASILRYDASGNRVQ